MTPDEFLNWKNARAQMQATRLPATMAAKPLPYDSQMEVARGQCWIVKTPPGGIPGRTSLIPGRAVCESFILDQNPNPPSLAYETNQDNDTLEQNVYNLSETALPGDQYFPASQVGDGLIASGGGGGGGAKRVQFRSTTKMQNGQITGVILLSEGEGSPAVGTSQVFADPFRLFYSGEVDAIGWGYYRPANEYCDLDEGRWEVEELSLPLDEAVGTLSTCLKKSDEIATVEVTISDQLSMWSQYHNVDLPPEMSPSVSYISANNTFNLDTCSQKMVRIRRIPDMLPSDWENCAVPTGTTSLQSNWHIVQVEEQIARWLKVRYSQGPEGNQWVPFGTSSQQPQQAWDGCDPFDGGCDEPDIVDPCGTPDCLPDNTCGIAHYNPEAHEYVVTATQSALLGAPTTRLMPVQIQAAGPLYPCAIEVTQQMMCVFESDDEPVISQVTPDTITVDVVTSATTVGSQILLNKSTITTCSVTPSDYDLISVCDLLCYCDTFYECCSSQCGCENTDCIWDWDESTESWINTIPCPEGCDCSDEPPPGPPGSGPQSYSFPCEEPAEICCDNVSSATAVISCDFQFFDPNNFDTTQGTLAAGSSSFSAAGPCGATLTFGVTWTNMSCGATQTTQATAVLKKNGTCCWWDIALTQPNAACMDGSNLGDGWPGSQVKVPTCDGEDPNDCSQWVGDCAAVCDDGGFDSVSFNVTNTGDCN